MKSVLLVLLGVAAAAASPAEISSNEISLEMRESQIMSIMEGVRQFSLLLKESWNTGSRAARAFSSQMKPTDMARALQENDPIEVSLKALSLDNEICRSRLICELQTKLTSYSMGDLVYEVIKRKVPKLKKYGLVTARDLGAQDCFTVFPCRANSSPLMNNARHLRSLVEDFCDLSGKSYTSSFCRGIKFGVDKLESL